MFGRLLKVALGGSTGTQFRLPRAQMASELDRKFKTWCQGTEAEGASSFMELKADAPVANLRSVKAISV